jgi:hypothetical protein
VSLDALQAQLLADLAEGRPTGSVVAAARGAAPDEDVAAWIDGWDPDLVALAGELIRTWGRSSD